MQMKIGVLTVIVLISGCRDSAKDREIAELRAKLAQKDRHTAIDAGIETVPDMPALAIPKALPAGSRASNLLSMCSFVEEQGAAIWSNLRIDHDAVSDEYGHIKDPMAFCSLLRERMGRTFGKSNAHMALINTFGSEIGTQIWSGTLCAPPRIDLQRRVPSQDELLSRFESRIKNDIGGWSRTIHLKPDKILDDAGGLRDPGKLAQLIRDVFIKRLRAKARAGLMHSAVFGSEVGAAVFSGRLDAASP